MLQLGSEVNSDAQSDPICSSWCPWDEDKKKKDQVVYGMYPLEDDIKDSQANLRNT